MQAPWKTSSGTCFNYNKIKFHMNEVYDISVLSNSITMYEKLDVDMNKVFFLSPS